MVIQSSGGMCAEWVIVTTIESRLSPNVAPTQGPPSIGDFAGGLGIKGASGMRKGDLISAIKERQTSAVSAGASPEPVGDRREKAAPESPGAENSKVEGVPAESVPAGSVTGDRAEGAGSTRSGVDGESAADGHGVHSHIVGHAEGN